MTKFEEAVLLDILAKSEFDLTRGCWYLLENDFLGANIPLVLFSIWYPEQHQYAFKMNSWCIGPRKQLCVNPEHFAYHRLTFKHPHPAAAAVQC